METWACFRERIQQWSKLQITDQQFYDYLINSTFECNADRRVADIFILQHDGGEWSHAVYHRM